jgi:hypothetical protein
MKQIMKKTLQFRTKEIAQAIAEYFPKTEIDNNRLIFLEFDDRAFDLAANLEGLNSTDFCCNSLILLEVEKYNRVHSFELLVDGNYDGITRFPGIYEFSLIVDNKIVELSDILWNEIPEQKKRAMSNIKEAWLIKNGSEYWLKIYGRGRSQSIQFKPKKIISKSFSFESL